ncbi:MAG: tyrosine-type recombinase/integrase [Bacteroidales bacterium]|nr:tyrosine-type recombinase/integrase [Bacteroidales bacterium]
MSRSLLRDFKNYLPAVVKESKSVGLCVEYFVLNPVEDRMMRRRVLLNRLVKRMPSRRERLAEAHRIAEELNARLRGGWTPLHETEDGRMYTPIAELQTRFLAAKDSEGCRPATLVQYKSVTDLWLRWCEDNGLGGRYSGMYLRQHAVRYMDAVLEQRRRHRSYNNTLKVMRAFFQWAVEHCYARENPFSGMKTLRKEPKIRILVPPEARRKVAEYYAAVCPQMNIVCQLVYSSAIRPAEIRKIQLKHIDLERHYILVPGENAKNHKERCAALTPGLVTMLAGVLARHAGEGELFLVGKNERLEPDREAIGASHFQKSWERMRRATGLPKEMQLYSLRDTGLTDLLHAGVDPLTVQHHADHSSLEMQAIYTRHHDMGVVSKIYEMAPEF